MTRETREPVFFYTPQDIDNIHRYLRAAKDSEDLKYIKASIDMVIMELDSVDVPEDYDA